MERFLRWDQIELMVCGDPKVDLALLRKVCKYEGFSEADDTIRMFWEVMDEISEKDRVQESRRCVRALIVLWLSPFHVFVAGRREAKLECWHAGLCLS